DRENSNHTLRPGGPPPIPKSPSKLRPAVPPPPKVTPSKELKTENIINLFDAAATPDISVTSPTEFDSPAVSNLLDMDLGSFSEATKASTVSQPANWDSWGKPSASAAAPEVEEAVTEETHAIAEESTEELPETAEMPPGFLFKVQVMHDYAANDTDELEMKAGDVVLVVTFDNTEEQ
ncbi:hypothetical protein ATANTOWER_012374, partial [Ataeniobius toweri]|nr:hypothetical protein [Ataeniobius toweri]